MFREGRWFLVEYGGVGGFVFLVSFEHVAVKWGLIININKYILLYFTTTCPSKEETTAGTKITEAT